MEAFTGPLVWAFAALLGAAWGSFSYTLALRIASGRFASNPLGALVSRSRCPSCAGAVPMLALIPIMGYALARGRCAHCGGRVSPFYPLSEILHAALCVFVVRHFGFGAYSLVAFMALSFGFAVAVIDIKTLTVPGSLVLSTAVLALYPTVTFGRPVEHLIGAAGMFAFFAVIMLLFPGGFGGGDLKYATAIGLFCGWELSIVAVETALITGALAGTAYALLTRKGLRIRFPFAPFLALGFAVAVLYGRELILLYGRIVY
ncbi:MAG: prepilin peptidase [Spirochaetota bacterium]|nr:prepilin peptidase [Spirochaetota bacterium]